MDISFHELDASALAAPLSEHENGSYTIQNHPIEADLTLDVDSAENDYGISVCFNLLDALDAWQEGLIVDHLYSPSAEGYTDRGIGIYEEHVQRYLDEQGFDATVDGYTASQSNAFNGDSSLTVYAETGRFRASDSLQKVVDEFVIPLLEAIAPVLDMSNDDYVWKNC